MEFLELHRKHKPVSLEDSTKGQWQNIIAAPVVNVLDFIFGLFHTENINRQEAYNGFKIYRGT